MSPFVIFPVKFFHGSLWTIAKNATNWLRIRIGQWVLGSSFFPIYTLKLYVDVSEWHLIVCNILDLQYGNTSRHQEFFQSHSIVYVQLNNKLSFYQTNTTLVLNTTLNSTYLNYKHHSKQADPHRMHLIRRKYNLK